MSNFLLNRSNDLRFIQSDLENDLLMPQSSHKNITFTSYFFISATPVHNKQGYLYEIRWYREQYRDTQW